MFSKDKKIVAYIWVEGTQPNPRTPGPKGNGSKSIWGGRIWNFFRRIFSFFWWWGYGVRVPSFVWLFLLMPFALIRYLTNYIITRPNPPIIFYLFERPDPTAFRHLSNYLLRQVNPIFLADLKNATKNATKLRVNRTRLEPPLPPPNFLPFRKFFFLIAYFFA